MTKQAVIRTLIKKDGTVEVSEHFVEVDMSIFAPDTMLAPSYEFTDEASAETLEVASIDTDSKTVTFRATK